MPDWSAVLELIRDLPALWSDPDARPEDRRALTEASFESADALGAHVAWRRVRSRHAVPTRVSPPRDASSLPLPSVGLPWRQHTEAAAIPEDGGGSDAGCYAGTS